MKNKVILFISFSILLASCGLGKKAAVTPETETLPKIAADTTVIPSFPAEVLYVLAREYEHSGDTMRPMGQYVEDRLIELYPEKAYRGMMGKVGNIAMSIMQKVKREPQYRVQTIDGMSLVSNNLSYYNMVSDSAEIDFLDMTEAEASAYRQLNEIADSGCLGTIRDLDSIKVFDSDWSLDKAIMSDTLPYMLEEKWVIAAVSLGMAPSTIYRILQSKARAEYVAEHYYKHTDLGRKGDAYKHVFVNLLLRKYVTERGAWLIMDVYWEGKNWNSPADRIMDYHNNMVGREHMYDKLVSGTEDWRVWALRLRKFIENTDDNASYMDWHLDSPELKVKLDERNSSKWKYIYWNKGDKTVQQYIDRKNQMDKENLETDSLH